MKWCVGLLISSFFVLSVKVDAADCPGTNLTFSSDDEIIAYFASEEANFCDVIKGDITFVGPAVTDVFWGRYFHRVEGKLTIDSTSVQNFIHFSPTPDTRGLEFVKDLKIVNNRDLKSLRGLHGLSSSESERTQSVEVASNLSLGECYQIAGLLNSPLRVPDSDLRFEGNEFGCNSIQEVKGSGATTLGFRLGEPLTSTTELGESFEMDSINLNYAYRATLGTDLRDNILVIIGETGGLESVTAVPVSMFNIQAQSKLEDVTETVNPFLIEGLIVRDTLVADFTGDGLDDIFLNAHGTEGIVPFPGYQNKLMVQSSDRYFEFEQARLPEITDFSHGSDFGDVDGDGDLDLFINNLGDDEGNPSYLLLNDGTGSFSQIPNDTAGKFFDSSALNKNGPFSLILDMDGDGDNDIFTGEGHAGQMPAGYLENRDGTFFFKAAEVFASVHYPGAFAYRKIDFNRDGRLDILIVGNTGVVSPAS
ncbi:MAG: VCBS repeat-containing protein, partial [Gammaproteobacteria bacterium]|nr:VCBS repeat-containing protein [Gammaproteobacteria bacterium]